MGVIDPQAAERVGWMLIHSLWQGAVIALALAVALRLLRRSTAQARYVVACVALVALVIAPVATLCHLSREGNDTSAAGVLLLPHSLVQTERLSPAYSLFGHEGVSGGRTWIHLVNDVVETLRPVLTWVVIVWFAGAAIAAVRQVGGWVLLRRLLSGNASPLDDERARFERIANRVGLHRPVRFYETALVDVPATLGWLRPLVLLPASALAGMDVRYVDALVAHELAHVRRHDYLINLLQAIAETMLFYHPAAWWISRRVRDEREQCCDDLAVAATGDAVIYAKALATMEQVRPSWGAYALSAAGGSLLARITRLVSAPPAPVRPQRRAGGLAALAAMTSISIAAASFVTNDFVSRQRGLDDLHPIADGVYAALNVKHQGDGFLPAVARAITALKVGERRAAALDQLVYHALRSRPNELSDQLLTAARVNHPHTAEASPAWPYGTTIERQKLRETLASVAMSASRDGNRFAARDYARAAILLASQESARSGGAAVLEHLLKSESFVRAASLSARENDLLRRELADHREIDRAFGLHQHTASDWLHEAAWYGAKPGETDLSECDDALLAILELAPRRPDIQLRLVGHWSQRRHHPGAEVLEARLRTKVGTFNPNFARWLDEAAVAPLKRSQWGRQPKNAEEFYKVGWRRAPAPATMPADGNGVR